MHAGKVVAKAWYQANKHIFPASKWEVFSEDKHVHGVMPPPADDGGAA